MVTRITFREYVVLFGILFLFLISAGKYYTDVYNPIEPLQQSVAAKLNGIDTACLQDINTTATDSVRNTPARLIFDGEWHLQNLDGSKLSKYKISEQNGEMVFITPKNRSVSISFQDNTTYRTTNGIMRTNIPYEIHTATTTEFVQEDFIPIYGYHDILKNREKIEYERLQMHEHDFEGQVAFATEELKCSWYTFEEIMSEYVLAGKKTPENACVMTFDDGNTSDYHLALPILEKYGVIASFYVIPEKLSAGSAYMNWEEVDTLYCDGHDIASHSYGGGSLLVPEFSKDDHLFQISEAKRVLEDRGYGEISTFAYPLGRWDESIVDILKETGHVAARDTSVDNLWRDRRTKTTGFGEDLVWHMHYHKPEQNIPAETLEKDLGYNNWWQFEEGYRVDTDYDNDILITTSIIPSDSSYGIVSLPDRTDKVSHPFLLRATSTYTISIQVGLPIGAFVIPPRFRVDEIQIPSVKRVWEPCRTVEDIEFCTYDVETELTEGKHTLSVESRFPRTLIDRYAISYVREPSVVFDVIVSTKPIGR